MTVTRRLVAAHAALLVLAACAAPEKGEVYGRYFYPAYDWVQMVCAAYNQNGGCSVNVPVIQHERASAP